MKTKRFCTSAILCVLSLAAYGQGTFVYDQQSADENGYLEGGAGLGLQPLGQSFTPTLSSVGFIRLYIFDGNFTDNLGATLYANLRTDSITGTILASTDPVVLPNRFTGPVNFFFSTPSAVAPGTTYYFQPVVQSGGGFGTLAAKFNYPGGTAFFNGAPDSAKDLWFREGVVVPEPSAALLMLVGVGAFVYVRHTKQSRSRSCD